MDRQFYIYLLKWSWEDKYYVGKGSRRRWEWSMEDHNCDIVCFVHNTKDEAEAFRLEDKIYCGMRRRGFKLINKRRPGRYGERDERSRSGKKLFFEGVNLTIPEWAYKIGLKEITIRKRLDKGWSVERALTEHLKT